uniref:Sterile alpha and TIR motif-containing protein 1 n=1 Tax=Elaeophora elaphi TaxID=1147741 RepID=A0A0R3S1F8_9BILA
MKRRSAFSSSVGRNYAYSSGCSGTGNSPGCSTGKGSLRMPVLGGRSPQSSLDSNDVGQISMNLMRVNGAIAPFKALLTSLTNPPDPALPTVPMKAGRSASSQHLSGDVSPKKLHKIGSHYVLENVNRKDGSTARLFDAPVVNVES